MIDRIPAPNQHGKLSESRFFLQDSWYDGYRGTVNLLQVMDGSLKVNDSIVSISTGQIYTVRTLGMLTPHEIAIKVSF